MLRKPYIILSAIITVVIIFTVAHYYSNKKINANVKLAEKLCTQYHDYLASKEYEKALDLINYGDDKTAYIKDLDNLRKYSSYDIIPYKINPHWVLQSTYNSRGKEYVVKCTGESIYNGDKYQFFENIYVKNQNGTLKIYKISTDDKFYYIRGVKVTRDLE